ncbi:MAG: ATP-binding protein [Leptospiraceae bacterium]|nr:ATP-binding protein [Leptospiraceae bacterium]
MHSLLKRQIRKYLNVDDGIAFYDFIKNSTRIDRSSLIALFKSIESSYEDMDRNMTIWSNSIEISTQELTIANANLRKETEKQKMIIEILTKAAKSLGKESSDLETSTEDLANSIAELAKRSLEINEEYKRAKLEAENASKAKSNFLANMSHEIRTPLNAILGISNIISDSKLDDEQKNLLEIIQNSGNTLLDLVNNILDFSKIESDTLELESAYFSIVKLIESTVEILYTQATDKNLELLLLIHKEVPEIVYGDEVRIRQVLMNLIGNSIKFTKQGEVSLEVKTSQFYNQTVELEFIIKDSGIGIPVHKLEGMFTSFHQADNSTTRQFGGSGIGLAISKNLIELMDGTISIQSTENVGTEVHFTLKLIYKAQSMLKIPEEFSKINVFVHMKNETNSKFLIQKLKQLETSAYTLDKDNPIGSIQPMIVITDYSVSSIKPINNLFNSNEIFPKWIFLTDKKYKTNSEEINFFSDIMRKPLIRTNLIKSLSSVLKVDTLQESPEQKSKKFDLNMAVSFPLKILLADDNDVNQTLGSLTLQKLGYLPEIVVNGEEVISAVQNEKFDLILLDLQMPIMGGMEAARKLQELIPAKDLPYIIALTADVTLETRQECLEVGMNSYLSKPFKVEDLKDRLVAAYHFISKRNPSLENAQF